MFQTQLIRLFESQQSTVVRLFKEPEEKLEAIRGWLEKNNGWLFYIEDVASSCLEEVAKWIPSSSSSSSPSSSSSLTGHVIYTAQTGTLSKSVQGCHCIELKELSMLECLNIWNQMECFGKAFKENFNQEEDETKRVERMTERTQKDFGNLLHTFIEHELGNLPLAVSLWGRILNPFLKDGKKEEAEKIMKQLKSNLDGMDEQGKGSVSQRILTMKQSVKIAVERLMTRRDGDGKEADEEREKAFQLMVSLALLHPTQTPLSFFQDDGYLVEEVRTEWGFLSSTKMMST